jgi:hypothetical protein
MVLRGRRSRRARATRTASRLLKVARNLAFAKAVSKLARRALERRGGRPAVVGAAGALLAGLTLSRARRRRAAREELEFGAPNESAPGHDIPAPPESVETPEAAAPPAPNEGATGAEPEHAARA